MVSASNQQCRGWLQSRRVREYALLLGIVFAGFAQNIERNPRVTPEVVDVHLRVVTDLFPVVSVRVAAENDEIVT